VSDKSESHREKTRKAQKEHELSLQERIEQVMYSGPDRLNDKGQRLTPFGALIQDYMARKRPIWTTGRMARELGVQSQSVRNWISKGMTPPIEAILTILAKLNIPLSALNEYYQRYGVDVPALMPPELSRTVDASKPASALSQAELAARAEQLRQQEWDEMIAHTRTAMAGAGFPESLIATTIASIEARRDEINPFQRYFNAEHREERPQGKQAKISDEPIGTGH
jgi:hypothetical protein